MANKITKQVMVVAGQSKMNAGLMTEEVAFFSANGASIVPGIVPVTATAALISTIAKTTTTPEPAAGTVLAVTFTQGNSAASPTIAFNGGTARNIRVGGADSTAAKATFAAGGVGFFYFDGTYLHQFGSYT